jgi:hypothetical protein
MKLQLFTKALIFMLQIKAGGSANYVCAAQSEKRTGLSP